MIAYCWHSVEGYSKFGAYEGKPGDGTAGSADEPFVYLGFKPAMVWIKLIDSAGGWLVYDNKRSLFNPVKTYIQLDSTEVEGNALTLSLDFLSNGFKIRGTSGAISATETYVYMAWAEMPFKYATAR